MDLNTASQVLLIVVSTVLSIFLILLVVVLVILITIMRRVKHIVTRAEQVADSVESAAMIFEKSASPLAFLKLVGNIVEHATGIRNKRSK